MDRRNFLGLLGLGAGGILLDQAIPFNRAWSFPKEIIAAPYFGGNIFLTPEIITRETLRILHQKMDFIACINREYCIPDETAIELAIRRPTFYRAGS